MMNAKFNTFAKGVAKIIDPKSVKIIDAHDDAFEYEMGNSLPNDTLTAGQLIKILKKYPSSTKLYVTSYQQPESVYLDENEKIKEGYICIGGS